MSKLNIAVLALVLVNFLSACQNSSQTSSAKVGGRSTYEGPSDGGGGDICNGKLIESYRVDITELDEYKEVVQPILDKLISKDDKKTTSPFMFSPKMKNWYIINCKLQDIPKERKGLFLESYQAAIHTSREVFIDSKAYASMAKEEKGKLLLHEMVMGYYLMKYLSIEDMCKITGSCSSDIRVVSNWKMYRPEPYRPLDGDDHQKIRSVTAWLLAQKDALTLENFGKILEAHDFDKRFKTMSSESEEISVDPQVIIRMFKKYQWTQAFPQFCHFDAVTNVSSSKCKTQVVADIRDLTIGPNGTVKQVYVKLTIIRESDQKNFAQEFSYPLIPQDQKIKLFSSQFGPVVKATPMGFTANWPSMPNVPAVEGLKSQMLFLMLNFADKENPEIFQVIYNTQVWYSFEEEISIKDGVKYKNLYGYSSLLDSESENLFIENELPFAFRLASPGKTFLRSDKVRID